MTEHSRKHLRRQLLVMAAVLLGATLLLVGLLPPQVAQGKEQQIPTPPQVAQGSEQQLLEQSAAPGPGKRAGAEGTGSGQGSPRQRGRSRRVAGHLQEGRFQASQRECAKEGGRQGREGLPHYRRATPLHNEETGVPANGAPVLLLRPKVPQKGPTGTRMSAPRRAPPLCW